MKGGGGGDRLHGGDGNDRLQGDNHNDLMSGGRGDDTQIGGAGGDTIYANLGVDKTFGGSGNDRLWALAAADVALPGVDTLHGEDGNDTFRTRDGEPDHIDCGPGTKDNAQLDLVDVIVDATAANPKGSCETVKRAAPKAERGQGREPARIARARTPRRASLDCGARQSTAVAAPPCL